MMCRIHITQDDLIPVFAFDSYTTMMEWVKSGGDARILTEHNVPKLKAQRGVYLVNRLELTSSYTIYYKTYPTRQEDTVNKVSYIGWAMSNSGYDIFEESLHDNRRDEMIKKSKYMTAPVPYLPQLKTIPVPTQWTGTTSYITLFDGKTK